MHILLILLLLLLVPSAMLIGFMMLGSFIAKHGTESEDAKGKQTIRVEESTEQDAVNTLDFDTLELDAFDFDVYLGWERIIDKDDKIIVSKFKGEIDLNHNKPITWYK